MIDDDPNIDSTKLREEFRHERRYGDVHKAYLLVPGILNSPDAELTDFFSAGECALRINFFAEAVEYMSKTIELSQRDRDEYYLDQAYFWRAYAFFRLNDFGSALSDLETVKHVDVPFYVYSVVPKKDFVAYSVKELTDMIRIAAGSADV